MRCILGCLAIVFLFQASYAGLSFPKNLSSSDRKRALEILGLSSSQKLLDNPYPLGGFSGFELGYSMEVIPTSELSTLGDKEKSQKETSVTALSIGKGLFYNFDIFFQFTPFTQSEDIKSFGGQLRWGFYQAEYVPAHLSLVAYGGSTNFQNRINAVSQGADLVAGFTVKDMTLYTGLGMATAYGTFPGGSGSINAADIDPSSGTSSYETKTEVVNTSHYLAGVNINFQKVFLALQLDRYVEATYAAKLGTRF